MSVRSCPSCGSEYLAHVSVCADCRVALIDPTGGAAAELDDASELVDYDLDDWTADQRTELTMALRGRGIPHRWEPGLLVVHADDMDEVEELIEDVDFPDALDPEDDGDDGAAEILSALYVASDILVGDPDQPAAVAEVLEATDAAQSAGVPYGLEGATWAEILRRADALADLLAAKADHDDVQAGARALRDAVRPLV